MDAATMVQGAIWLFAIAAVGGLVMAFQVFSGRERPWSWLAMVHGFLGAAGITLLAWATVMAGLPSLVNLGLGVLVLAVLGGVYLALKYHVKQLPLSRPVVVIHATVAVVGFLLVLVGGRAA